MALNDVSLWRKPVEHSGRNTGAPVEALAVDGGTIRLVGGRQGSRCGGGRTGGRFQRRSATGRSIARHARQARWNRRAPRPCAPRPRRPHTIEGANRPPVRNLMHGSNQKASSGPTLPSFSRVSVRSASMLATILRVCPHPVEQDNAWRSATIGRPERARPMLHRAPRGGSPCRHQRNGTHRRFPVESRWRRGSCRDIGGRSVAESGQRAFHCAGIEGAARG